jgi:quercetin dioxygenase-like cupin family protein
MIEELGGRAVAVKCDVARVEDVRSALDKTIEAFGRLDIAFNNVGALGDLQGLNGMSQGFGRKSLAGSMIGGIAETQEVIDEVRVVGIPKQRPLISESERTEMKLIAATAISLSLLASACANANQAGGSGAPSVASKHD